jgi:hypothetical protein
MKYIFSFIFCCLLAVMNAEAQNVGIKTETPEQTLDVNGKIKIGDDNALPVAGTVRFNTATNDFEGYTGTEWKSLTATGNTTFINNADIRERKGNVISIHGDFAAVGAPFYGTGGAVYIYKKINGQWVQQQILIQSAGSFGISLDLYGDYLVVGSPFYVSGLSTRGRITLYKKSGNSFVLLTHYQPPVFTDEFFGASISIHGGLIAVGCNTSQREYVSNTNRVHIFSILNEGLQPEQIVFNPNAPAQEDFGISVTIDSTHLIVGAPKADDFGNTQRGKVYVYQYAGANTYTYTNTLEYAPYGNDYDYFGETLSLDGNTLVIGSPGFDITPLTNIGAIYTCEKNGTGNFESPQLSIFTHPFDSVEVFF